MATDLQIKQQRAELRKRFFMLLQNEVPEGFNRQQVEKDLRELAAGLVLKGVINKDKWETVTKIPDHDQQLLEIIELVLSAADENKDEAPGVRMEQLVEELKQHQEVLKKQAEQKATKQPSPHQQAEKIIAAQARAYRQLQQDTPQAAEAFQDVQEEISTGLMNNPGTTLPAANHYVTYIATRENPNFTTTDASIKLGPIVEPARDFSQPIDTLVTQIAVSLPPSIKEGVREEIAQTIVSFKLTVPNASRDDYKPLLEKIELDQAARNQTAVSLPPEVVDTAIAAKIDLSPDEIVQKTIKAKLQQAGVPEAESQKVAQVITNFAPAIHYVSSFVPSKTPQEYEKNKREVTQKLTNHVVDRILMSPNSPRGLLQILKSTTGTFDFYKLYTTAYGPAQFYQYQPQLYDYPSRPDVHTNDPYLTYLASYTRDTVKDAAVGVALDWVVAGPIGGWILPDAALASAFVFDAGITAAPVIAGTTAATAAPIAATVGAGAATTTAGATTATTAGGALGSWLGPAGIAIGAAIGAIVGWLVKNKDKIWKWLKNNVGPLLVGLTVGAVAIVGALIAGLTGLGVAAVGLLGFGAGVIVTPQIGVAVSNGPAAALQPIATGVTNVLASLTELAIVEIATPLIAIILAIPVVVALLLFIITNSAYVVPPEGSANPSSGGPYTGPLPEGCPTGWPTDSGVIRQGAWVSSSFRYLNGSSATHVGTEAIDDAVVTGTPVKATHRGVAIVTPINSRGYGNFIEVHSKCTYKGVEIAYFSRYAHLSSFTVSSNTLVEAGQLIGLSGNTGNSTGPHLHYEFRRDGNLATHYEQDLAPFMWPNFIPENPIIKRGCIFETGNSYPNQCSASW